MLGRLRTRSVAGSTRRSVRVISYVVLILGVGSLGVLGVELARLRLEPRPEMGPVFRDPGGTLVICGGGRLTDEVRDRFLALAGGREARIVVIPTAHGSADDPDADRALAVWRASGAASVTRLHTRSRSTANAPEFVRPLTGATGVWIGGGSQSALTATFAGTAVERELKALLDRGGVVGGSSAGAAVMTRVMIASGRSEATLGRGFDLLPGAVVDQHFLRRNRVRRLLGVLAGHPDLVGFGIDERTALVVGVRGRRLRVIGESYVVACIPAAPGRPERIEALKRGDEVDLTALRDREDAIAPAMDLDEAIAAE